MRSKFNILCPAAQLLIADRPAYSDSDLANRLGRKEKAGSLSNSTASREEEEKQGGKGHGREGGLSLVLPKSVLHAHSLGEICCTAPTHGTVLQDFFVVLFQHMVRFCKTSMSQKCSNRAHWLGQLLSLF